jgi:BlaR1 peptidase M56
MNWLHYLLEANLYLAVFYAGYYLFLSRETYYTLNRIYLLFSCIASFALPVMQLGILKPVERPITAVHFTFATQAATATFIPVHISPAAPTFTWQDGIVDVYLFGAAVLLVVLLIKLYQLLKLTSVKKSDPEGSYKVVQINGSDTAFSFFNYLFIGTKVQQAEIIIKHELVHIRQKHSADIVFIELLKIVNWFNPFIYLLQYSLREIHEYIADEKIASSGTDALTYSSFLVNNAYGVSGSSITHSFFNYNLLKKRIIMLHQKRSGTLARLRYLLAIPICGGLLCASTLAFSKTYGWVDIAPHRIVDIAPHRINKANTSPQVVEPKKRLVIIKNGKTGITDKLSVTRADGSTRIYTANNLSNKDREDLKKQGITIDIISIDTDKTHIAPPPPPAPPVKRVKFPLPRTSKGYPFSEYGYTENGKSDIVVTIREKDGSHKEYDKNKATTADLALLKEKYGYVFPAHLHMPPPPPPVVVPDGKTPPPPPPAPPKPTAYTKKGYKYSEDGYLIDGKTDFRVIIFKKDGNQVAFFKSKASDADVKLLKNEYGYTFPVMDIHAKMPPPPPAPAGQGALTDISAQSSANTITPTFSTHYSIGSGVDVNQPFLAMFDFIIPQIKSNSHLDKNKDVGTVQTTFSVNDNHAITNAHVAKGLNQAYDQANTIALSTYYGNLSNVKPGDYILTTQYYNKPYGIEVSVKIDPLISITLLPPGK